MLILPRKSIERLVTKGQVDVWSPCETRPAMNVQHVVRASSRGQTITSARASSTREGVLQLLTVDDARAAGFRTEDEFFTWWRRRYATGPLLPDPVRCYVTTYLRVDVEIPQFLDRRGYTTDALRARDVDSELMTVHVDLGDGRTETKLERVPLEAVTDPAFLRLWAEKAESDRQGRVADLKAAWKRRRRGQEAA